MRKLLLLPLLVFALAMQTPTPEDYPGQRGHGQPPDGWYCSHNDPNPAKACTCKRMDTSHDCDDPSSVREDRACKVYCHKSHCHCQVMCEHPDHKPGEGPEDQPPASPEGEDAAMQHKH